MATVSDEESSKQLPPGHKRTAKEVADHYKDNVANKVFVVTGAYSGIGVETTKALLAAGAATVIVGGRNRTLQDEFVASLEKDYAASGGKIDGSHVIDLADLASVQQFAAYVNETYSKIDVLILNAGIMNTPAGVTVNGLEQQMGVNCIGHFLLAKLLSNTTTRQVWVSSLAHLRNGSPRIDIEYYKAFSLENSSKEYVGWNAYQQSKLGDILLAKEFGMRYPQLETCSLHPGVIRTNLSRHLSVWDLLQFVFVRIPQLLLSGEKSPMKTVEQGAATTVHCASLPTHEFQPQGAYYVDCDVAAESESARNEEDATAFFDYCDQVTRDFQ